MIADLGILANPGRATAYLTVRGVISLIEQPRPFVFIKAVIGYVPQFTLVLCAGICRAAAARDGFRN